jgi:hypothetical protein
MWRLAISEMSNKTVYKGQKIVFMGTIKAQVTAVYVAGRKMHSALFSTNTKPVFRSESARFVLFIQMSREMWDFDSEGSGEIMFTKVVNGFLPALFKKWVALRARHLVSIVLFTRVEYDTGLTSELAVSALDSNYHTGIQLNGARKPYKDFYRVVVSEMASGEWTTILWQLKREFRNFRHDITMHRLNTTITHTDPVSSESGMGSVPGTRIEAEPTLAIHGNLLEAINLAATQFSHDYIDRDLLRTGISIVLITPGAGLFEVDYETLRITTETLIGSGIGIDLVCLPKIPLHSVPLFRYRNPQHVNHQDELRMKDIASESTTPHQGGAVFGSYSTLHESISPSKALMNERHHRPSILTPKKPQDEWSYAIPHWLDVSFWTGASQELNTKPGAEVKRDHRLQQCIVSKPKDFSVRCKMYELEMSSISNDGMVEISVAALPNDLFAPQVSKDQELPSKGQAVMQGLKKHASFSEPILGPTRSIVDKKFVRADRDFFDCLDAYDAKAALRSDLLDRNHLKKEVRKQVKISNEDTVKKILADDPEVFGTSFKSDNGTPNGMSLVGAAMSARKLESSRHNEKHPTSRKDSMSSAISSASALSPVRPAKIPRQISLGFRGFGITAPKAVVAEVQTENANAAKTSESLFSGWGASITRSGAKANQHLFTPGQDKSQDRPTSSQGSVQSSKNGTESSGNDSAKPLLPSSPIAIKTAGQSQELQNQQKARSMLGSLYEAADTDGGAGEVPTLQKLKSSDRLKLSKSKLLANSMNVLPATLSPTTAMSPWLTVLNPSNPTTSDNIASQYKRWQHVFPKPLQTKAMKWKSLCSPASVPLTTEYFPTQHQLDTEYQQTPYNISQDAEEELSEVPKTREEFLRELISLRLSQGFQIVIGPAVADAFGQKLLKIGEPFSREQLSEDGGSVFMALGNNIHQLSCVNGTEVEVNMFVRKTTSSDGDPLESTGKRYRPAVRTTLATDYESREIALGVPKDEYNWNYVDSFIAGHDDEMTESLRFWRARFVLIPVLHMSSNHSRRGEDNEEETRLEGIKALTQMWQRYRYIPPSERQFQNPTSRKRKDPNPLDIVYQTQDPSVVVNAELETLTLADSGEAHLRRGQLLSEKEPFRKVNFNVAALAEAIQAPIEKGGVRMQNRRWHFRLHYNCFIGSDMTTWILENFEDIETRGEAEELGNMLMAKDDDRRTRDKELLKEISNEKEKDKDTGLFVHVERRHPFRDGQYFYQMNGEYAKPRPEARGGWPFGSRRRETSVPSTPMSETATRDSPKPERILSSSGNEKDSSNSEATTPTLSGVRKPKVALSKVMKYDVDHRRRSYRPERINLHYDRLHNPDNCYHIRIDWLNVTSKLIEDAIQSWATTAERYGLRLIEVPIGEASSITDIHPFRSPYSVKLAIPPPDQQPATYFDATSLTPQVSTNKHFYQKAILKKHNFVLDVEAASNFPANVEVTYSWGRPDYKYSQYIHRSGVVLAQITDDGNFLLLANKLYNNRAVAASREQDKFIKLDRTDRATNRMSSAPGYGPGQTTPVSSPMLRGINYIPSPSLRAVSDVLGPSMPNSKLSTVMTPESIADELEEFCNNANLLENFYKEALEKATPPTATPPVFQRVQNQHVLEQNIPALGLGPGLFSGLGAGGSQASPSSMSMSMRLGSVPPPMRRGTQHSEVGSVCSSDSPRGASGSEG